jgi:7-cyano-7-deazaguanine reductase
MKEYTHSDALKKLSLGKPTEYTSEYDASLLQAVPRSLNRQELKINAQQLPFSGEDIWYGYELSWLSPSGKPEVSVAEFRFPCQSPNIVESKSFKLYLNSFNQSIFSSKAAVQNRLITDLSAIAGQEVKVTLFAVDHCPPLQIVSQQPKWQRLDDLDIQTNQYDLMPELLDGAQSSAQVSEHLVSHLLKSNCLITNQPDWASLYISYQGKKIDHSRLLKYIISFRNHNEFHEQCVERIYCDIQKFCPVEKLTVFARYTRRGGLDINPFRSNISDSAPNLRTIRQ